MKIKRISSSIYYTTLLKAYLSLLLGGGYSDIRYYVDTFYQCVLNLTIKQKVPKRLTSEIRSVKYFFYWMTKDNKVTFCQLFRVTKILVWRQLIICFNCREAEVEEVGQFLYSEFLHYWINLNFALVKMFFMYNRPENLNFGLTFRFLQWSKAKVKETVIKKI